MESSLLEACYSTDFNGHHYIGVWDSYLALSLSIILSFKCLSEIRLEKMDVRSFPSIMNRLFKSVNI